MLNAVFQPRLKARKPSRRARRRARARRLSGAYLMDVQDTFADTAR